jgi:hypothetical protein
MRPGTGGIILARVTTFQDGQRIASSCRVRL